MDKIFSYLSLKEKPFVFTRRLRYLPKILQLIWATSPGLFLAWFVLLILQGTLPVASVQVSQLLVDNLVEVIGSGSPLGQIQRTLILGGLMAGILLLIELAGNASNWIRSAQAEYAEVHIMGLIHEKAVAVDLAFYESPEYHDLLNRAHSVAKNHSMALLDSLGNVFRYGLSLVGMAAILIPYGIWIPLLLIISTLPGLYIQIVHSLRYHEWWRKRTADRRWISYFDIMLTSPVVAPEMRLFDLGGYFQSSYRNMRRKLRTEQLNLLRNQSIAKLGASPATMLITAAVLVWILLRTMRGLASLGDLVLFYQAFQHGQGMMHGLLGSVGNIYSSSVFLGDMFVFLEQEPEIADPVTPRPMTKHLNEGISLEGITFQYPGSERTVLRDFNFEIPAGKTIAIVGPNGAGKSTLIKLLCRFYDPQKGSIKIDGVDLREFAVADLRRQITVAFQLPVAYHATAAENIRFGDLHNNVRTQTIEEAATFAGAHEIIERLPQKYETLLGKTFVDGTELSVGEWQRVAIARSFLRPAPIILLDEPTSFMDSWTETAWMRRFRQLVKGRTAIFITQRFTTAMNADRIFVMEEGRIVESGTHHELINQDGLYAQSWTAQMDLSPYLDHQANVANASRGTISKNHR